MLDEVQLLVAGGDDEVIPVRRLVRAPRTERGIGEDHIIPLAGEGFIDGIAQGYLRLQPVQV